jgi:membrane peptidoglycan carboxypeptidase
VFSSSNSATNTSDRVTNPASADGATNGTSATYDTPFDGGVGPSAAADWVYCEVTNDPLLSLGGSVAADKMKLFFNFVQQTQTIAPSLDFTQLFDATAPIQIASRPSGLANVDTTDWAACYYCNGIPSLSDRVMLARWNAPTTPPF